MNNTWIHEFWYGFIVLIGIAICIIYYVHNKKKAFRQSIAILSLLCLFSLGMHKTQTFNNPIDLNPISAIDKENFGASPDFLGKALERAFDFIKRRFF